MTLIEDLEKKVTKKMEKKHWDIFKKQTMYLGCKTYRISNLYSTCTRELFLMYVAQQEFNQSFT